MIIESNISWGFVELLKTFFSANQLDVICEERIEQMPLRSMVTLQYEDNSETAMMITFMSIRHLGFENMLCDYLTKCGVPAALIPIGKVAIKRDMKKLDQEWEERRRELGFR
jgi:hypothetical protein